jgi:hypothetical protein
MQTNFDFEGRQGPELEGYDLVLEMGLGYEICGLACG